MRSVRRKPVPISGKPLIFKGFLDLGLTKKPRKPLIFKGKYGIDYPPFL